MGDRVNSVVRSLDLLNSFSATRRELSIGELALSCGLPKSTVSRLLLSLMERNFIEQDNVSHKYRLGFQVYILGNAYAAGIDLRHAALPLMKDLGASTEETINLSIIDKGKRICIEKIESSQAIRSFVTLGEGLSLCFGAAGRILLANLPETEKIKLIDAEGIDGDQRDVLLADLARYRSQGYCLTIGDRIPDMCGISAPIYGQGGVLLAGLSLSGPASRLVSRKEDLIEAVVSTALQISLRLGFVPYRKLSKVEESGG